MRSCRILCLVVVLACSVTPTWAASCNVSAVDISFGSVDALQDAMQDTSGTLQVTCSGSVGESISYAIALAPGSGGFNGRTMKGGAGDLAFNLYIDPARLRIWGDGSGGTAILSDSFTLDASTVTRTYTIYARMPAGHSHASAGTYGAQLLISVTY